MRKFFIGFFLLSFTLLIKAQDRITLKNGTELKVYILEKNDTKITYKLADTLNNYSVFTTKLYNLNTISYANGMVDLLSSQNPRSTYRFGLSAGARIVVLEGEGGMLIGGVDYMLTPNISSEINLGNGGDDDWYYSFGGKYWFANRYSKSALSPYTGLLYGGQYGVNFWEVPMGVSFISKHGFQLSLQLCYMNYINASVNNNTNGLNLEFRIGWRLK